MNTPEKQISAINSYRAYLSEQIGEGKAIEFLNKILLAIQEKNVVELKKWMNGINPKINLLFSRLTCLPAKTQKDVDKSLGLLNPEQWKTYLQCKKERKEKIVKEKYQRELEKSLSKKVKYENKIMTLKDFYTNLIKTGYKTVKEVPKGKFTAYHLSDDNGFYYPIKKKNEANYIKTLLLEGGGE